MYKTSFCKLSKVDKNPKDLKCRKHYTRVQWKDSRGWRRWDFTLGNRTKFVWNMKDRRPKTNGTGKVVFRGEVRIEDGRL